MPISVSLKVQAFDTEKLNEPTVINAFKTTISGRSVPLAMLVDEGDDLQSLVTNLNKVVTDTAVELLRKQHWERKPWVIPEILYLCKQRRGLNKN